MNITNADSILEKKLIDLGVVKFLIYILNDKTIPLYIRKASQVPINNLLSDEKVWKIVLFENQVITTYCTLLNDNNIDPGIFSEISFGFHQLLFLMDNIIIEKILDEYFVIQLICKAMKQIINNKKDRDKLNKAFTNFLNLIMHFLKNKDDNLINKILILLQKSEGEELIDFILSFYSEKEIKNNEEIQFNINLADAIKKTINNE